MPDVAYIVFAAAMTVAGFVGGRRVEYARWWRAWRDETPVPGFTTTFRVVLANRLRELEARPFYCPEAEPEVVAVDPRARTEYPATLTAPPAGGHVIYSEKPFMLPKRASIPVPPTSEESP